MKTITGRRFDLNNLICRLAVIAGVLLLLVVPARAQVHGSPTNGSTPLGLSPGAPAGSYALSGFDTVNLFNGHLNFSLPIMQMGGRGGMQVPIVQPFDQSWHIETIATNGVPLRIATYGTWQTIQAGYGPCSLVGRTSAHPDDLCHPGCFSGLTRLTFTAPDGTEYELRDTGFDGAPFAESVCFDNGCNNTNPGVNRGRVFHSADGTSVTFISDSDIFDYVWPDPQFDPSGWLLLRDGTRFHITSGFADLMEDRNGNRFTFSYVTSQNQPRLLLQITDSLNRTVTFDYASAHPGRLYDEITFTGFSPTPRKIFVRYDMLSNLLRPNSMYGIQKIGQLFPDGPNNQLNTTFDIRMVKSVELPDGRSYNFYYNPYGEIARVVLPTGGGYDYEYTMDTGMLSTNKVIYRRVTQKRTYSQAPTPTSGGVIEGDTLFSASYGIASPSNPPTVVTVDHTDGAGTILAREKHYFNSSPADSILLQTSTRYPAYKDGKEFKTEMGKVTGSTFTVLRTVENTWEQRDTVSWWTLGPESAPPNDPRLTQVITTLADTGAANSRVTKQTFGYDQFNNQTDACEYDFGTGAAGTLLRHTHTDYLKNHPSNSLDYSSFDINNPESSIHIRNLPLKQIVNSSCSDKTSFLAKTEYEYDIYASDSNHAPLVNRLSLTGHNSSIFSTARQARGNVTAVKRWLNTETRDLTNFQQYDITGNLVRAIDPKGFSTAFDFTDNFGTPDASISDSANPAELQSPQGTLRTFAFVTKVTNALNQISLSQFNYYLGRPVDVQDPNGSISTAFYDDALDRPSSVIQAAARVGGPNPPPERSRVTFEYDDILSHTISTKTDLNSFQAGELQASIKYDGLGRTIESRKLTPDGTVFTTQTFDPLGRPLLSSNPFYTAPNNSLNLDTYGYSITTYDSLSRVTQIQTFDKNNVSTGVVLTDYDNDKVTVTDQAGRKRRSLSDALGRLIRVDEPNPSTGDPGSVSSPVQPTSYTYDLLGNLTTVTQSSASTTQLRRFAYDSLSRLIFAANPEQSSSSLLTFNNQSWAVKYEYDDASNLRAKSDSRLNSQGLPLKVSFTYDNLHRLTTRSYNDTPLTPSVTYTYDTATNGVGRLASVITAGVSTYNYTSYDSLGRLTSYNQVTAGQTYPMACSYNLAGLMTSQTYPSGKVVKTDYDSAGRISGVSNQSGAYYAGSLPSDNTNRLQYSPAGALTAIKFGNQLWEHTDFNSRQQATLIGLGVNKSDSSKLKLDFDYGSSANNGNLLSQKITSPSSSGSLLLTQTYTYDFLNRLSTSQEKVNQESSPRWSQVYSYDRFANRTSITNSGELPFFSQPAVDPATNRHVALSYDSAGNQLSDVAGRPLTYDADSHVRSFTSGSITYTYSYDGDGRRVRRDFNDGSLHTTVYVYDATGLMLAEYTSDPIVTVPPADAISYLTSDQLGSPRVVTRSDGSVKARHDYLPFGEDIGSTIASRSTVTGYASQDSLRQKFTSKERDAESGLDYFLVRYYSSAQGRFTSPDEFTGGPDDLYDFADAASDNPTFYANLNNPQSFNKYQYCYNNPVRYVDPDGHDPGEDHSNEGFFSAALSFVKGAGQGAVDTVVGTVTGVKDLVTHPIDTVTSATKEIGGILKADYDIITHPRQAAGAIADAARELGPNETARIVGHTTGAVVTSVAISKGIKAISETIPKLGQRGGVGIGSSKTLRLVAKSNPSETSVGVIMKGKRVLDIGRAQIKPGRPKQFHIRIKNGPHRGITGKIL